MSTVFLGQGVIVAPFRRYVNLAFTPLKAHELSGADMNLYSTKHDSELSKQLI